MFQVVEPICQHVGPHPVGCIVPATEEHTIVRAPLIGQPSTILTRNLISVSSSATTASTRHLTPEVTITPIHEALALQCAHNSCSPFTSHTISCSTINDSCCAHISGIGETNLRSWKSEDVRRLLNLKLSLKDIHQRSQKEEQPLDLSRKREDVAETSTNNDNNLQVVRIEVSFSPFTIFFQRKRENLLM